MKRDEKLKSLGKCVTRAAEGKVKWSEKKKMLKVERRKCGIKKCRIQLSKTCKEWMSKMSNEKCWNFEKVRTFKV